ncbi:mitochondrial 54S ribosomal protein YmL35 [Malassezia obtusa]|uniref:Mitochondrial 54S ribosomal protein YmL35 n=1 Tax=Malassezia obtusa TaxID=76774 RepID=A0AAF0E000_9BASI|nr:mitochondrial 54S ribosomal protein YmL35 [Malassezia obtusa]
MVWRIGSAAARSAPRVLGRRMQSQWAPVLEKGKMPVYDEALAFVEADAAALRERVAEAKKSDANPELVDAYEIASEINLPQIRADFLNGKGDLGRPVFRHLREQAWRLGGSLDQLVERATLMNVLPDVVPSVRLEADLQVIYGTGQGIGDHGGSGGDILPGVFLSPAQTREAPQIAATVFHPETRHYTLMMVDPDRPNEDTESFETFVHWLVHDIPLSATQSSLPETLQEALAYVPPHPQQGTPYHRYTMLLFEQSGPGSFGDVPRSPMNVSTFAQQHGLQLRGLHFWREQWTKENKQAISAIYRDTLGVPEPRYGYAPRQDKLKDALGVRHSKYY